MTACGTNPKPTIVDHVAYRDHFVVVTPDPSLRHCIGEQRPPKPDLSGPQADRALATALVQEDAGRADCAAKLRGTWDSIDQANAKATAANAK